jgi:hypothetical protein
MRALVAFRFCATAVATRHSVGEMEDWSLEGTVLLGSRDQLYSVETERSHFCLQNRVIVQQNLAKLWCINVEEKGKNAGYKGETMAKI